MAGHTRDVCNWPLRGIRRWRNRVWVCSCGRGWTPRLYGAGDGAVWTWYRWPSVDTVDATPVPTPDPPFTFVKPPDATTLRSIITPASETAGLDLDDLKTRLEVASSNLRVMADQAWSNNWANDEKFRLEGKVEGVELALSYLKEMT